MMMPGVSRKLHMTDLLMAMLALRFQFKSDMTDAMLPQFLTHP